MGLVSTYPVDCMDDTIDGDGITSLNLRPSDDDDIVTDRRRYIGAGQGLENIAVPDRRRIGRNVDEDVLPQLGICQSGHISEDGIGRR